ncbi:hypothetical protein DSM109990_01297 [Sulfitobacter dubius]|uniref:Uncharacterized protein n=2 Tax=Sulfitobacter dubius TaxID=218673 RepID=A0ABY3ZIT6_9RHOB|nr:hypothetical protein DSM109990_01297 [Sulfitobacter dubius]
MDWAEDSAAKKEERNWGALDHIREANDGRWLFVYGWVLVAMTVTFALLFLAGIVSWSWHYLVSERWHWLNDQQLSKVQSVIFSGGLGAILSSVVQKQISKNN